MQILDVSNFVQEVGQIVSFRESRKLRRIVQANVNDGLDAGFSKSLKESFRVRLGKSDCTELDLVHCFADCTFRLAGGSTYATLRERLR